MRSVGLSGCIWEYFFSMILLCEVFGGPGNKLVGKYTSNRLCSLQRNEREELLVWEQQEFISHLTLQISIDPCGQFLIRFSSQPGDMMLASTDVSV